MASAESLRSSIQQYEKQLAQVLKETRVMDVGPDRINMFSLMNDLHELIDLTKENLRRVEAGLTEDPLAKEYALFKEQLEQDTESMEKEIQNQQAAGTSSANISEELQQLEGMKCRVPFSNSWGSVDYHNAMICSVFWDNTTDIKTMQDIKVKVFFLNPIYQQMFPCRYYLDGKCRFSDQDCRFSHGELASLSSIQEYREPDFQSIEMGSRVLAKQKNGLWQHAVVMKMPENVEELYRIKFVTSGTIVEIHLQDILPLGVTDDLEIPDPYDGLNSGSDSPEHPKEVVVQEPPFTIGSSAPLGTWEKHTRGIGSKIMARMGYVVGTGLGKESNGRVEPVVITLLPVGKSLDHCMKLWENAGGDKNLFSVERRMQKEHEKLEKQRERQYQRDKERDKKNVFNFINATLGDKPKTDSQASYAKSKSELKTKTNQQLNLASFQVGEDILKLERELSKLKEAMGRRLKGSVHHTNIMVQYNEKQKELLVLKASEKYINTEQNQRKNRAKLSTF